MKFIELLHNAVFDFSPRSRHKVFSYFCFTQLMKTVYGFPGTVNGYKYCRIDAYEFPGTENMKL